MDRRSIGWALTFLGLVGLAIPWFLWGSQRVVAGLPIWLWWHIAWLGFAAIVFRVFATRAWGLWITDRPAPTHDDGHSGDRQ
ncbi:MAG: DUF3311 domain-containing protein [Halodesulfurarchaeum sp.]|nr:DUF3311 domain-containing protein [Halodesulfurarchaeum sp.]